MATIKELSESIGISKVGLTKWIERNGYKDRLQKIGNKYIIPADVEQAIRAEFDRREPKPQKVAQNNVDAGNEITSEILALLREQLESKDKEIERLHKQVDDLQKINADMVKAVRELNTIQAMQLTDGTPSELRERTTDEPRANREPAESVQREDHERSKSEAREIYERTSDEQRKKSLWNRLKKYFR